MSVIQLEDLGFCRKGEGRRVRAPALIHHRRLVSDQHQRRAALRGSGGLRGRISRLGRILRQLTGRNLARPVPDARFGLAVGFGMITYDRGLCSGAAVLGRADA